MTRKPIVAGNWKMYKTIPEAMALGNTLRSGASGISDREIVVAPPFTALAAVAETLEGSGIALSGQNTCWENEGAYTGEISPIMLKDVGCRYVIIGHSERRHIFGERDETIARKIKAALDAGLQPIFCIGETLEERENGETLAVLRRQVREGLKLIQGADMNRVVIAYEPVWAIGTGKTATNEQAQEAHSFIRTLLEELFEKNIASDLRILYGGSVKVGNVDGLMAQPDIDGVLVGGASLEADSFLRIIKFER
ncbi:MAG: triose-phosphate isomerase [Deltaproteobacteria bacterium]|nr:triose-phosphate isomerase [Deltaproteobacteria bacterium]